MNKIIITITLAITALPAFAQLAAPARPPLASITDLKMIVMDRGSKLEVFPKLRVVTNTDSTGRLLANAVTTTAAVNSPLGRTNLGVIYNHAMQQRGYISGEIAFKTKAGIKLSGTTPSRYPVLKRITSPEVYVVNARTPAEFMTILKRLQGRDDLESVEPTVTYGVAKTDATNQALR